MNEKEALEQSLSTVKQALETNKKQASERGTMLGEIRQEVQALETLIGGLGYNQCQCGRKARFVVQRPPQGKIYVRCTGCNFRFG